MEGIVKECNPSYSVGNEDRADYLPNWWDINSNHTQLDEQVSRHFINWKTSLICQIILVPLGYWPWSRLHWSTLSFEMKGNIYIGKPLVKSWRAEYMCSPTKKNSKTPKTNLPAKVHKSLRNLLSCLDMLGKK